MTRTNLFLAATALAVLATGNVALAQPADAPGAPGNLGVPVDLLEEVRDSFIFVFDDSVAPGEVQGRANALARANGGAVTRVYTAALRGFAAKMPSQAAARLAGLAPGVAYFEADGIAYAFAKPPWAGGGDNTEDPVTCTGPQVEPPGVARVGGPLDGIGFTAWVIDTGIDLDHPDLDVDVGRSRDFVSRGKKSSPDDGHGHGTHVAGTIAALDNDCDVVGVAAGATVVAVRVLDNSGSGSWSGVIAGVDYVAAAGAAGDAANMSLGGLYSQAVNDAVEAAAVAGVRFALAAGNSSDDARGYSPASAEDANIWTVSAVDSTDTFAWFSNYGNPPVDCAAPGVSVLSTKKGGGTTTMSGTSMAAPHVAGLLLFGAPGTSGTAVGDPDGWADPICHF